MARAQAREARARFVRGMGAADAGSGALYGVFAIAGVVDPAGQRESAGPLAVDGLAHKHVAQRQGVVLRDLMVDFDVFLGVVTGREDGLGDGNKL